MEDVRDKPSIEFIDHEHMNQKIKRQSTLGFKIIVDHYSPSVCTGLKKKKLSPKANLVELFNYIIY